MLSKCLAIECYMDLLDSLGSHDVRANIWAVGVRYDYKILQGPAAWSKWPQGDPSFHTHTSQPWKKNYSTLEDWQQDVCTPSHSNLFLQNTSVTLSECVYWSLRSLWNTNSSERKLQDTTTVFPKTEADVRVLLSEVTTTTETESKH